MWLDQFEEDETQMASSFRKLAKQQHPTQTPKTTFSTSISPKPSQSASLAQPTATPSTSLLPKQQPNFTPRANVNTLSFSTSVKQELPPLDSNVHKPFPNAPHPNSHPNQSFVPIKQQNVPYPSNTSKPLSATAFRTEVVTNNHLLINISMNDTPLARTLALSTRSSPHLH
jgi:hypothetical protein